MKPIHFDIGITIDTDALATIVELFQEVISNVERKPGRETMTPYERSQHAIFRGQKPPEDMGLLVKTREAAKLLKVSQRTLVTMYQTGIMPKPIRIGRSVRWSYEELRAWVNAGRRRMSGSGRG